MAARYEKFKSRITNQSNLDKLIDSAEDIQNIAKKLTKWEVNCHKFNLSFEDDVPDIKQTYPEPRERRIAVIWNWIDSNPERYTYGALLKICSDTEMAGSANAIVDCCNNETGERERKANENLERFKAKLKKPSNLSKMFADEDHINRIANDLMKWEENSHKFGLKRRPDVQDIKRQFRENPLEQRIQFLHRWIGKCGTVEFGDLLKICASVPEMSTCARTIIDILNEDSAAHGDSNNQAIESDHGVTTEGQASGAMDKERPGYEDQKGKGRKHGRPESQTDVEGKGHKRGRSSESQAEEPLNNDDYFKNKKLFKPKVKGIDYSKFCKRVEYVISTANTNEFKAGCFALDCPDIEEKVDSITSIEACVYIGNIGCHAVGLVKHDQGTNCKDLLTEAIQKYFPNAKYLVAVGVCYGFRKEITAFGDVVISNQISDLGNVRIGDEVIRRGDDIKMMEKIKHIFCDLPDRVDGLKVANNRKAKHKVGIIVSTSVLVDNESLREKIYEAVDSEALGGEMEGGGLLQLQKHGIKMWDGGREKHVQVIIIKAVVDYADGKKDKKWQFIAAQAAFHYAKARIELQTAQISEEEAGVGDPSLEGDGSGGIYPDSDKEARLDPSHLNVIHNQLGRCSSEWVPIARKLEFSDNEIELIQMDPEVRRKYSNGMYEVIRQWLRWSPEDGRGSKNWPTLKTLQEALKSANHGYIILKIR